MDKYSDKKQIFKGSLACFLGSFGSSFFSFSIGMIILKETNSALSFGITQIIGPICATTLAPFILRWLQSYKLKKILYIAQLVSISSLLFFEMIYSVFKEFIYIEMIGLITLLFLADYVFGIAYNSAINQIVTNKSIVKLKSYEETVGSISLISSPIIAATLSSHLSLRTLVFVEIVFEALTIIVIVSLKFQEETSIRNKNIEKRFPKLKISRKSNLFGFLIIMGTSSFIFSSINLGLPFLQINIYKLPDSIYGLSKSLWSAGMLLSGILLIKSKKKETLFQDIFKTCMALSMLLIFLGIFLSFQNFFLIISTIFLFNLLFAFAIVRFRTFSSTWIIQKYQQDTQKISRFLVYQKTINQIFSPLGYLFYGVIFEKVNSSIVFGASGSILLLFTILFLKRK